MSLSEQEIRVIADEAAERAARKVVKLAVHETLIGLGMDPTHPMAAQADMMFLRATRQRCEQAGSKAAMVMIALIVGGAVATFWKGFVGMFK